jgi:hypothetical protein
MNRDDATTIDALAADAFSRSKANGHWSWLHYGEIWREPDERIWLPEKIALAHSELSEALDHSRKVNDPAERYGKILGELGDTIWRCLDMGYVINQYIGEYPVPDSLGTIMQGQAKNMTARGHLHGKRW